MTKTAKQILLEMSEFDISKHPEHLDQALKELEAIISEQVIGRPHDAWCEPHSEKGCTCHVKHQLERLLTALYGKESN